MIKMTAAYWHQGGLDIYTCVGDKVTKLASGVLEDLKPLKRGFGKKVLILGRDRLMHVRKRYPPASHEKLVKAVGLEISDMVPFSTPDFYCRIFRSLSNYVELDIWVWDSECYPQIKKIFPFSHVIPEDVLFSATVPEVRIIANRGLVYMVAHTQGRFLGGASHLYDLFDAEYIDRFLLSLSQAGHEIKRIRIYGLKTIAENSISGLEVTRVDDKMYPPCLEGITQMNLKAFRIKHQYGQLLLLQPAFVMRVCLYLVLGYVVSLFLTITNYDRSIAEIRQRISTIDKKAGILEASQPNVDYADVIRAVNARLQSYPTPLKIIHMLNQKLPPGSTISRIVLNESSLELQVSSKEPLTVIKSLETGEGVERATVKGVPFLNRGTGLYNFTVNLEMVRKGHGQDKG